MAPFGSIQLHGCMVASGSRGEEFLQAAADVFLVPVVASKAKQKMVSAAIRFQGPIVVKCPGEVPLQEWCRGQMAVMNPASVQSLAP